MDRGIFHHLVVVNTYRTITYTYGDTNWKDKLTNYNGKAITYDAIGNPLTYDGYTYTWQKGRQLATITGNSQSLTFKYNQDGLRTKKINGSTTTEYLYDNNLLKQETDGTKTLNYLHDSNGKMLGVQYNGTNYYYMHNVQGDVIALYDSNGDITCRYIYDSWGKLISVKDNSGTTITSSTHIANVNPIRYRGYYYDTETGLYYLQSRYYNPDWCRFLNADDSAILELAQGNVLGANLFAYCYNNPVMLYDETGQIPVRVLYAAAGAALFGGVSYLIGKALGISGRSLAILTGSLAALGAVAAALLGPKLLAKVAPKLATWFKKVARGTRTLQKNYNKKGVKLSEGGIVILDAFKIMFHPPHGRRHNYFHIQIEVKIPGVGKRWTTLGRIKINPKNWFK